MRYDWEGEGREGSKRAAHVRLSQLTIVTAAAGVVDGRVRVAILLRRLARRWVLRIHIVFYRATTTKKKMRARDLRLFACRATDLSAGELCGIGWRRGRRAVANNGGPRSGKGVNGKGGGTR